MSTLIAKLTAWMRSPRGKAVLQQVRQEAAKPENRRRLQQIRARWTRRH